MELQGTVHLTAGGITLDHYMLLLLAIMLASGVLGGLANYFLAARDGTGSAQALAKYVVLGIVAALTVPVFLNMISSDLLALAKARPVDLFVFAGFCLLFVLFSRRFVDTLADKLMQQLRQARR